MEVEIVNPNPKPPPEKVLKNWIREWFEGGRQMELKNRLSLRDIISSRRIRTGPLSAGGVARGVAGGQLLAGEIHRGPQVTLGLLPADARKVVQELL